jgi:hypothetical protein
MLVQVGEDAGLSPAGPGADGRQVLIGTAILPIGVTPVLDDVAVEAGTSVLEQG